MNAINMIGISFCLGSMYKVAGSKEWFNSRKNSGGNESEIESNYGFSGRDQFLR